ncbi:TetR/AcrR family transcriptional regulator [Coraliomargarita sp. W4R53]
MSEPNTRERILNAGVEIMLERSFHSVGLNQLLSAVKVPKGSFYHYFKSKEQFGVEVLRHYAQRDAAMRRQVLSDAGISDNPAERLISMFSMRIDSIEAEGGKCPCLLQKVAIEVSSSSEPMREELANCFESMIIIFQEVLEASVNQGFLPADLDTRSEAEFILDLWAGAQQRTAIIRDVQPVRHAISLIRQRLQLVT